VARTDGTRADHAKHALVTDVLILILCVVVLALSLGLPFLLKPDSLIPDIAGVGLLTVMVVGFAWVMEVWWICLPVLAIIAFVAWLDRKGGWSAAEGRGEVGRTQLRFQLWRAANGLLLILGVCVLALFATGSGLVRLMVPWIPVFVVASFAFRFSFYRSCRQDARDLPKAGEASGPA
jgi:hypothetical protein